MIHNSNLELQIQSFNSELEIQNFDLELLSFSEINSFSYLVILIEKQSKKVETNCSFQLKFI